MDENANLVVYEIDDALRTITIPGNGSILGVCGDTEINRVRFKMPRYCAGFDLSDFVARVNYVNPNGDANYFETDEVSASYDSASFVWLMGSDATDYAGDVEFSVRLYKKQDETIIKSFNTRAVTGRVLEGLDVEKQVTPEQQQTLIGKLEAEIKESIDDYIQTSKKNLIDTAKTDIEDVVKKDMDSYIQTTKETLTADVKADVSKINEDVTKLKGELTEIDNLIGEVE